MDDEETWIREKKIIVSSEDYGRDLIGVRNLHKKHQRIEAEVAAHAPAIQQVLQQGEELTVGTLLTDPEVVRQRMEVSLLSMYQVCSSQRFFVYLG